MSLSRGKPIDVSHYGIELSSLPPFEAGRIDPRSWFADASRPFELEIGSGKGTFLIQEATARRDTNLLGFEWAGEFYRYAADRLRRHELDNALLVHGDATEFIRFWCADAVAEVVHLYFSDPWPKARHHKRRVVQDRTLMEFHRILRPGGLLHLVTDHDDLWTWYEEHATRNAAIFQRRAFAPPQSAGEGEVVGSNFER